MEHEAGGAAGKAGGFCGRKRRIPQIGVEAVAVDPVGLARDDIEQRRHHFFWFDEARGLLRVIQILRNRCGERPVDRSPSPGSAKTQRAFSGYRK